jgi:hypothetical protein
MESGVRREVTLYFLRLLLMVAVVAAGLEQVEALAGTVALVVVVYLKHLEHLLVELEQQDKGTRVVMDKEAGFLAVVAVLVALVQILLALLTERAVLG